MPDSSQKEQQLDPFREDPRGTTLSTDQGVPIPDTDTTLKAGERGPDLLEDFHFRERITHFDHEPIPERVVHARGSAAHGYFECTRAMGAFTKAKFLAEAGKRTPVFVRFSQVVGSKGSADSVRDVRGFATKFYTEDGNYDLVGNNIPVFFIQDAIKFPDLVHAIKPEQDHHMPQASSAHDTFWDFISLMPESAHMILWLMSDRAIVRSYRMMEGFGVNTYRFVNESGKAFFVKFHWKPVLGIHSLVWDEAQKLGGKDPDWLRRDLWEAIELGDYPTFEFGVQLIPEGDEDRFDFDVLDATKIWPEEEVPVQLCGRLVLDRNPDNFFAETEQVAFCPGNLVPGVDVSEDPLLQGRLFSYIDTQISRLGGPNFTEIPINRPLAPVHNYNRDAMHRQTINTGKANYFPNSIGDGSPAPADPAHGFVSHPVPVTGTKIRARGPKFADHFTQAALFWNSMSEPELRHIIRAFHFELGKVTSPIIRQRMVDLLGNVSGELAAIVAEGINCTSPLEQKPPASSKASPALSQECTVKDTVASRRIAVLAADGFDYDALDRVRLAIQEAGAHAKVIGPAGKALVSSDGRELVPDFTLLTASSVQFDATLVADGEASVEGLVRAGAAIHWVNETYAHCKALGGLGAGAVLLSAGDFPEAEFEGEGVRSRFGVVTAPPDAFDEFMAGFLEAVAAHRHWERDGSAFGVPA